MSKTGYEGVPNIDWGEDKFPLSARMTAKFFTKTGCTREEALQAQKQICPAINVPSERILHALEELERQEDYQKYVNSGADAPWLEA